MYTNSQWKDLGSWNTKDQVNEANSSEEEESIVYLLLQISSCEVACCNQIHSGTSCRLHLFSTNTQYKDEYYAQTADGSS
eukprot:m.66896 g.66896  ORF g.66896 m.66896 type:complete len:80 (+) comp13613_c2_seq2:2285-2524(+)